MRNATRTVAVAGAERSGLHAEITAASVILGTSRVGAGKSVRTSVWRTSSLGNPALLTINAHTDSIVQASKTIFPVCAVALWANKWPSPMSSAPAIGSVAKRQTARQVSLDAVLATDGMLVDRYSLQNLLCVELLMDL